MNADSTFAGWEFWVDVGGTFTDCLGAPWPTALSARHKVLSSSRTKGCVGADPTPSEFTDSLRVGDPERFWIGYTIQFLDDRGTCVAEATIDHSDSSNGLIRLDRRLDAAPIVGQNYEIVSPEAAPLLATRYLSGRCLFEPMPPLSMRLGTTRGTNALLTRRGAPTAFVTTRGFGDILEIGYQQRPELFRLNIQKPTPLYAEVIEIDERITPDGTALTRPDVKAIEKQLRAVHDQGIRSLAICLLNAYAQPRHEIIVADIARQIGFTEISVSHVVSPLIKLVSRGDTTLVDAYLNPVLVEYVKRLRHVLDRDETSDLRILTSAGGLVAAEDFTGKDSILSGPAGGVVGFSRTAMAAGFQHAIGFDMGGTSTDVSRFDGRFERQYETEKAGVRIVAPMLAIETVAAGGGSVCQFDGVQLRVGPDSAGADPGPACYGRGGPLAVTDLNFYLGKIQPDFFPFPLSRSAVQQHLTRLCREITSSTGKEYRLEELAEGFVRIANANMAKAIRSISIAKGCDPRQYVLVSFGGAGPQHACAVARQLGIRRVLNHPDAGVLSAYGIGLADVTRHAEKGVYEPLNAKTIERVRTVFDDMIRNAASHLVSEGIDPNRIDVRRIVDLRYVGMDAFLSVPFDDKVHLPAEFERQHRQLYGYLHENRPLEIVAARIEAVGTTAPPLPNAQHVRAREPEFIDTARVYFDGRWHDSSILHRHQLQPGVRLSGPAVILEATSTTVIDPGWTGEILSDGQLLLTDTQDQPPHAVDGVDADPITLEIFNNQFAGIAEQMGVTLRNTSSSVNVKERLDFSCALFTATGDLVVNAPHIPVHLGAMSETVRHILREFPEMRTGDVFVTNDPYQGGSHLPDVTVVTPVHQEHDGKLLFFTASRAHHAEIGGIAPGSMPPESQSLAEEGVLIRVMKLVDSGESKAEELRELLLGAPYPTRAVEDNLADIAAQVAANHRGADELRKIVARHTAEVVGAYMVHIQSAAERKVRAALVRLGNGHYTCRDFLDDGSPIAVEITVKDGEACFDFTGTGPVMAGNLNANHAIVTSAVMYVLRCLLDDEIPMNAGMLVPTRIVLPECLLNPPRHPDARQCAAVVGGNVETSQRLVDALLLALGAAANSQGTMNNVLFGDDTFGYYETICGGAGATPTADGASAVHTHMTNTRLTDPEVMERRFPVRVREFSVRRASGGNGVHRGGDGVTRRIEFTRPVEVSVVSQRRGPYPPHGLAGGEAGTLGENLIVRGQGRIEELPALARIRAESGDVLVVRTPGGGGYGDSCTP